MGAIFEGTQGMKSASRYKFLVSAAAAICGAWAVQAQTVGDNGAVPTTSLNLPANIAVFGKVEPTVRKATAIVNGEIITGTDIDHRLALIVIANGGKISVEEKARLRLQVLRNLIDETLQIQEAKANKIEVSRDEVSQSYTRVSQNFKRTPEAMTSYLRQQGSSDRSIRRQIEGEVAWSRLLRRKVEPSVTVSEQEVNSVMERLNAAKGTAEYHVGEIYLSASPENTQEVLTNARKIIEQIRGGGSFAAYARQFSEASTAAVGGDLDWIRAAQLPDALSQAVQEVNVGQIVGPVEIPRVDVAETHVFHLLMTGEIVEIGVPHAGDADRRELHAAVGMSGTHDGREAERGARDGGLFQKGSTRRGRGGSGIHGGVRTASGAALRSSSP